MPFLMIYALVISFSAFSFDHEHKIFNEVLSKNVEFFKHHSQVNYKSIKKSPKELESYLSELSQVQKQEFDKFSKNQQLAFLINTYNAFTIKLIIDHYPVKTIKDIGGIFSSPWSKEFISLFGKKVDLDDIEHGMIRKMFQEPRIHFAVNCASIGCPALLNEAYTASKLDKQLEFVTKAFLGDKTRNNFNSKENEIVLSKIFKWYSEDFESGDVLKFVAPYFDLSGNQKKIDIEYSDYDWKLNEKI